MAFYIIVKYSELHLQPFPSKIILTHIIDFKDLRPLCLTFILQLDSFLGLETLVDRIVRDILVYSELAQFMYLLERYTLMIILCSNLEMESIESLTLSSQLGSFSKGIFEISKQPINKPECLEPS